MTTITCAVCGVALEDQAPADEYNGHPLCAACAERAGDYQDRVEDRIERLETRAEKKRAEGKAALDRAHQMADGIPFGQPILVGHHSERRDRNYRNRIHETHRRGFESLEEARELERRATAAEHNHTISGDDPLAVLKLEEKIAAAETQQARMRETNKVIRKTAKQGHDAQVAALAALGYSEDRANHLLTPDLLRRIGFPDYMLTNNSANIRRMKQRVEELRAQAVAVAQGEIETTETEPLPGVRVVENVEENRVQIFFTGKPNAEVRGVLKTNGWRWAPSQGAWQRQLNNGARYSAENVMAAIKDIL